jgi:hypothetical protein
MVIGSWNDGERSSTAARTGRSERRPLRRGAFATLLVGGLAGCLDMLGDVNVDGVGTEVEQARPLPEECTEAALLDGTCVVRCTPGMVRCNAHLLQRCNSEGDAWTLLNQCASAVLCDATAGRCAAPACGAEEHRCAEDGQLQVCKADRSGFELREQCRSAAYCITEPGRQRCAETECRAGRQRCNGAQIEECRTDRTGFDPLGAPCASAALCVEGEAEFPHCETASCTPGVFVCSGRQLSRCADNGQGQLAINECATPELCLAAEQRCADPLCAVGAQRCTGAVLERCNDARNGFLPVETCSSPAACNPTAAQCTSVLTPPDPSVVNGEDYSFVDDSRPVLMGLGPMRLSLPGEWSDVDESAWTNAAGAVLGPRLIASTDAQRFAANFDIPGVYFAATAQAPLDVAARQAELDLTGRCTRGTSNEYEDELYTGTVQTWTNCGSANGTTSVVVVAPREGTAFVAVVIVTMLSERDEEAREEIWDSFVVEN